MASSVPSPSGSEPYEERRAYPRVEVALPAFLDAEGQRHSVQMLDLSAGGVKLSCSIRLEVGTPVTLGCGTFDRGAVVRWQNDRFLGLSFGTELDARELSALVDRSNALTALRKTRE